MFLNNRSTFSPYLVGVRSEMTHLLVKQHSELHLMGGIAEDLYDASRNHKSADYGGHVMMQLDTISNTPVSEASRGC